MGREGVGIIVFHNLHSLNIWHGSCVIVLGGVPACRVLPLEGCWVNGAKGAPGACPKKLYWLAEPLRRHRLTWLLLASKAGAAGVKATGLLTSMLQL